MKTDELIKKEILDLHQSFQDWYNGKMDKRRWDLVIGKRLSDDFLIVFPDVTKHAKADLRAMMLGDHGNDRNFKIEIKDITIAPPLNDLYSVSYEEWQYGGGDIEPQLKLKTSSVLKIPESKEKL